LTRYHDAESGAAHGRRNGDPKSPDATGLRWREGGRFLTRLNRRVAGYVATKQIRATNLRPLVTFTFDDVPDSTFVHGAPVLEALGTAGTFYVAGGLCGGIDDGRRIISASHCVELHDRGHEIGCHTFSHAPVPCLDAAGVAREFDENQTFFASLIPGIRLDNFAYPFGSITLRRKLDAQRRFVSCRGIREGINSHLIDLGMLSAVSISRSTEFARIEAVIEAAVRCAGWLIFYTHDVAPEPTAFGCTPALLRAAATYALGRGCEVVTVRRAIDAIRTGLDHEADPGTIPRRAAKN
jgi:peptidoglycan/xylan/chitin deacetylase (PgdA/CDA1 family)